MFPSPADVPRGQLELPGLTTAHGATGAPGGGDTWLLGQAMTMRAVAASPTLRTCLADIGPVAAADARGRHERTEDHLAKVLADCTVQAAIAADVTTLVGADVPGLGEITGIGWERHGGDHDPADWTVTLHGTTRTASLPVNLKTRWGAERATGEDRACSAAALLRAARGLPILGQGRTRADDVDAACVAWHAGTERIRGCSDYFLLVVSFDADGTVRDVRAQGLLSTVMSDGRGGWRLACRRQPSRPDGIVYTTSDTLLPTGWDVNAGLAHALLRPPSPAAAQVLRLAAMAAAGASAADLAATARAAL